MKEKILNDDVIIFVKDLRQKGYGHKRIAEIVKEKFSLKNCSVRTLNRALQKKSSKNTTGMRQDSDN